MKALVLFSGGLDSTTCLALAIEKYGADEVIALSVSYGQKHTREIDAANAIAAHYGVKLQTLDLPSPARKEAAERMQKQLRNAREWCDIINTYFHRMSGVEDAKGRELYL